jgi:hypothetical protein
MYKIRSVVKGNLNGRVEIFTEDNIKKMKERATVR